MRKMIGRPISWIATSLLLATASVPASAQLQTGSLFGIVLDPAQVPLPGATVTLSGIGAPQTRADGPHQRRRQRDRRPGSHRRPRLDRRAGRLGYVYISNGWSYALTGMYRIAPERPRGVNVAASLNGREGYPIRYTQRVFRTTLNTGRATYIPVTADTGRFGYPNVHLLDLRIEKEFALQSLGLTLSVDVFNALNETYVLQRQLVLGRPNSDHVVEVLSPRIFRLGARFHLN